MNDRERYEDPALARRVRDWVETEAPPAAPERIVFAVMDEVERLGPRRSAWPALFRFAPSVAQYAVLTLVIAVGVASGILLTRSLPPGETHASPPGSPSPSATEATGSPRIPPSLPPGITYRFDAVALAASGSSLWVATSDGTLYELDPATGAERGRATIGFGPSSIGTSGTAVWLVADDHDLVRFDIGSHATTTVPGTAGHRVTVDASSVWIGQVGKVLRIDAAALTVVATFPVAGHRSADPIAVSSSELFVATNTAVERLDIGSGASLGSIPGDASDLSIVDRVVWIARGSELIGFDLGTGQSRYIGGMPGSAGLAADASSLWTIGPPGAGRGELVEVDPQTGVVASRTLLPATGRAIVLAGESIWVATEEDRTLRRFHGS